MFIRRVQLLATPFTICSSIYFLSLSLSLSLSYLARSLSLYLSLPLSLSLSLSHSLSLLRKNWTMLLLLSLSLVGKAQLRLQMRCLFHLSTKGLLIWVWYVLTWLELSAAVVSISCELLRCYYKFSAAPAAACCQKKEKAVSCHCVLTLLLPAQG